MGGAGAEDRARVAPQPLAAQQEPPGHVAQDRRRGVGDRADEALGLFRLVEVQPRVHRRDDEVEGGEGVLVVVERAVGEDVALDALQEEDPAPGPFGVHAIDLGVLLPDAGRLQPPGIGGRLAVVRDAHPCDRVRVGPGGVLLEAGRAVAPVGVHVGDAADVPAGEELRECPRLRRGDLPHVLAQLRRDPRKPEQPEHLLLVPRGEGLLAPVGEDAPLAHAESAFPGAPAHGRVVLPASGEVMQREGELPRAHDAQVGLHAVGQDDRGLRLAVREHAFDGGHGDEELHHGSRGG